MRGVAPGLALGLGLALGVAQPAGAQPADPAWAPVWEYMAQSVCTDAQDRVVAGATPLESGCGRMRTLRVGEALPYHKRDWPGVADRPRFPDGYQQSDSVPVMTARGPAVLQTFDFGDDGRAFGKLDLGDGGQLVVFTPESAAVGVTEDGGAGLQLFIGPDCTPVNGWVVVNRSFLAQPSGETVAHLTREQNHCPAQMNEAYTHWWVQPVSFRFRVAGGAPGTPSVTPGGAKSAVEGRAVWTTLVSEHFDAGAPERSRAMERMHFTKLLGHTRWEAWRNLGLPGAAKDGQPAVMAAALAKTERCGPALPMRAGWVMVDCREWTQLVPPAAPAGDAPFVWLDRLRAAPTTAGLMKAR